MTFNGPRPHALLEATDVRHARLNGHDVPWDGARLVLHGDGVLKAPGRPVHVGEPHFDHRREVVVHAAGGPSAQCRHE
ncbi:hypothetical protein [Saccharothrix sp.]|uniref:hypothetical protein n=1 Tax=Saccharothrix sp. TaxID=1873460 RepID=UPI0028115205|nr:hypothetical protein [Saccharothrix sp.]